jgi:hypothetical protein
MTIPMKTLLLMLTLGLGLGARIVAAPFQNLDFDEPYRHRREYGWTVPVSASGSRLARLAAALRRWVAAHEFSCQLDQHGPGVWHPV